MEQLLNRNQKLLFDNKAYNHGESKNKCLMKNKALQLYHYLKKHFNFVLIPARIV